MKNHAATGGGKGVSMLNLLLASAATSGAEEAAASTPLQTLTQFLPLILIVAVFYFLMIRPQKKREKQTQEMRSKLEVGDEIITVGGIVGRVVSIKDDTLVIETGTDRSKLRIAKWAIQTNNTATEKAEQERTAEVERKSKKKKDGE